MADQSDNATIRFFEAQFQRQVVLSEVGLNPFEERALPFLRGQVLDYGCGLGNLACAAASRGCTVLALDASGTAIARLQETARAAALAITAKQSDLRKHELSEYFDAVVAIGILMFFDRTMAVARLRDLVAHVRPGGVAVVNVLVEGTTYMDMFDPAEYCLFSPEELMEHFQGWHILRFDKESFPAPRGLLKAFATVIARRPQAMLGFLDAIGGQPGGQETA